MPNPENVVNKGVKFPVQNPRKGGRKPGVKLWGTVFSELMPDDGFVIMENVQEIGKDGKPTGAVFKKAKVKLPTQYQIAMSVIKKIVSKGDVAAFTALADRMEGKPPQRTIVEGIPDPVEVKPLTAKQITALKAAFADSNNTGE